MDKEKKYYKYLDLIRLLSCLCVLFYHLGYFPGGFLSVCCFFVLSGFLSYQSLSKKKDFSFIDYYKKRFFHIYLPLLIVVSITIGIVVYIPNVHWFNLKPESLSVLLGYNNYWQLSVNADYFARHLNSPFMHFWYIAILLQFDLLFPFVFLIIQKTKDKIHKSFPLILLSFCSLASIIYFCYSSMNGNVMISYYNSLARVYSLLFGVILAYWNQEYGKLVPSFKNQKIYLFILYGYLLFFVGLQFFIKADSPFYSLFMILFSIISVRMIEYSIINDSINLSIIEKGIKVLSNISYEIYLVQYPILFCFQYLTISSYLKLIFMLALIFGISYLLSFSLHFKNKKYKVIRIILASLFGIISIFGLYQFIITEDHSEEISSLKKQLNANQELLLKKQKEYKKRLKDENDEWESLLQDLENGEAQLQELVSNLAIVGVGDSVMLGAVPELYNRFPSGYFDAQVSRTDYEANGILQRIKNQGLLSDNVIIHLGTNGQCGLACQQEIINTCEGRNIYWVTVSNDYDVHVNSSFYDLASSYDNVSIIDWYGASDGHPEYFVADGIHLTGEGMRAYAETIYQGIYQLYHQQYEAKKEAILLEHEKKENNKISFYGNDILLSFIEELESHFSNSNFMVHQDYQYDDIVSDIKNSLQDSSLNHNVLLAFDSQYDLSFEEYQSLISLLKDREVYLLFIHHKPYKFDNSNVHIINFYNITEKNKDYLMVDQIHISPKGEEALLQELHNFFITEKEES